MCIFYRLCLVLGSHLLFIRHHMRSGWSLGMKLLEGRNILWVPEGMSATVCAWKHHHLTSGELLHTHSLLSSPESDRARGPVPVPPGDWLDRCPGILPGMYTHAWIHVGCADVVGIPHEMFLQSWCVTRAVPLCTKERISFHFGAQSQLLIGLSLCPAPFHFRSHGDLCLSGEGAVLPLQETGQSPRKGLLQSTEDELGFWLTSWSQGSTNSPWHRGRSSFPFHSCLERQAYRFL